MKGFSSFLALIFLALFNVFSQSTVQLFIEDFNGPNLNFQLNSGAVGLNSGNNKWIINNSYDGMGVKPNTTSQDSTYGGQISFAPYSSYLHIYDSLISPSVSNCNFDNTNTSDQFVEMSSGICTKGITNVEFSFFFICEGGPNSYGELYYNTGSGAWIQTGISQYKGKSKWKYEQVSSLAFDNVDNLRFGFRWVNDVSNGADSIALGIDDIQIVGTYNSVTSPITIDINYIDPVVCPGDNLILGFQLSDTLCDGSYSIEMSDAAGNFSPPTASWSSNVNYPNTSSFLSLSIPFSVAPSSCYLFRVTRLSPAPVIVSTLSACVEVDNCPNVISTIDPPAVTLDTNYVCINSVIDVPFWSTGVYNPGNVYIAQLSDSTGSFSQPNLVGTSNDNTTYDPALVPSPGMVSGSIPTVPPGCGYYLRVLSSNPNAIGQEWGPFCIQECDISTNNCTDVSACPGDSGVVFNIPIDVNVWDSIVNYYPGNTFSVEVLDMMSFAQINLGGLGATIDTSSATLVLTIPPCDSLAALGLTSMGFPGGAFYMRITADNSSQMEQSLGCVVHLSIGCPNQTPYTIQPAFPFSTLDDTLLCVGNPIFMNVSPYNPSSEFNYYINGSSMAPNNPPVMLGVYWTTNSVNTIEIEETSFGCVGPLSIPFNVYVIDAPQTIIIGSDTSCIGDTLDYLVQFYNGTYYDWDPSIGGTLIDTGNNEISILWDSLGVFNIEIEALNKCGNSTNSLEVSVIDQRGLSILGDTIGCEGDSLYLIADGEGSFSWENGEVDDSVSSTFQLNDTLTYVQVSNHCGVYYDTVNLVAIPTSLLELGSDTTIFAGESVALNALGGGSYYWTPSNYLSCTNCSNPVASPLETTTYFVVVDTLGCISEDDITVNVEISGDVYVPNLFSPNNDGINDFLGIYGFSVKELEFRIYDRWGELVFQSNSMSATWDGTFKGATLNSAVFVYTLQVTYVDGREQLQHGNITLIR
jgi:gliding motility-associated-like protein